MSRGVVVEASILARLLGIRLLRLNAHIDMMPTDFDAISDRHPTASTIELSPPSTYAGTLADATALLRRASRTLGEVGRERVVGR
jgi:hypothetical protein